MQHSAFHHTRADRSNKLLELLAANSHRDYSPYQAQEQHPSVYYIDSKDLHAETATVHENMAQPATVAQTSVQTNNAAALEPTISVETDATLFKAQTFSSRSASNFWVPPFTHNLPAPQALIAATSCHQTVPNHHERSSAVQALAKTTTHSHSHSNAHTDTSASLAPAQPAPLKGLSSHIVHLTSGLTHTISTVLLCVGLNVSFGTTPAEATPFADDFLPLMVSEIQQTPLQQQLQSQLPTPPLTAKSAALSPEEVDAVLSASKDSQSKPSFTGKDYQSHESEVKHQIPLHHSSLLNHPYPPKQQTLFLAQDMSSPLSLTASLSPAGLASDQVQIFGNSSNFYQQHSGYSPFLKTALAIPAEATTIAYNATSARPRAVTSARAATSTNTRAATSATQTAKAAVTAAKAPVPSSSTRAASTTRAQQAALSVNKSIKRSSPMTLSKINLLSAPHLESAALTTGAQESLKSYLGRPIDAQLLNRVLQQLTHYYQDENGYDKAQAYLPAQAIENGEVNFVVAAPALHKVQVKNNSSTSQRYLDYLLSDIYALEGEPIQREELFSRMLRLSDLGVFSLPGYFKTVAPNGLQQDLILEANEFKHRFGVYLFTDNYGTETSGRYRFGGQLRINNILGLADQLHLFYARTNEQQNNYSINYELPITPHGTALGVDFSYNDYELSGWYRDLGAQGNSYTLEGYVREPLYRDAYNSVSLKAGVRYRDLEDEFSSFDLKFNKHSVVGYAELNGFKYFGKMKSNVFGFMQRFSFGHLTNDDEWGLWEDQDYVISNSNLNLHLMLDSNWSTDTDLTMQLADHPLEGSEQFSAAGPYGLKAFSSSDLSGDSGVVLSQSVTFKPWTDHGLTFTPHIEIGHIDNKNQAGDSGASAGLTMQYVTNVGFNFNVDFSHTIGERPMYAEDDGRINFTFSYLFI